ncbi:13992_t:CDS:1 [Ambispora leptoticha]|uniref:13992_t:CDS:1 n=1 Tax=Ambispora leptoticha TaxID=144679 RepID=A0A9N8WN74_9GLOM|nr:13992_t:CDS:1 [Ambispora leptoticha]
MQTFLSAPSFNKTYLYATPQYLYHEFANVFSYYIMVKEGNMQPNKQVLMENANKEWKNIHHQQTSKIKAQIKQYLMEFLSILTTIKFSTTVHINITQPSPISLTIPTPCQTPPFTQCFSPTSSC